MGLLRYPGIDKRSANASVRELTTGHIPYQFDGCPSSEDHRRRRRRVRSPSPIEFSPSPSPQPSSGRLLPATSPAPHPPSHYTPPSFALQRNAWRGRRVLDAYLAGDRQWPAPRGADWNSDDSSSSEDEDEDTSEAMQRDRKRRRRTNGTKSRKPKPSASGSVPRTGPERSPVGPATRTFTDCLVRGGRSRSSYPPLRRSCGQLQAQRRVCVGIARVYYSIRRKVWVGLEDENSAVKLAKRELVPTIRSAVTRSCSEGVYPRS